MEVTLQHDFEYDIPKEEIKRLESVRKKLEKDIVMPREHAVRIENDANEAADIENKRKLCHVIACISDINTVCAAHGLDRWIMRTGPTGIMYMDDNRTEMCHSRELDEFANRLSNFSTVLRTIIARLHNEPIWKQCLRKISG